jgi:hypothetical protein
MEAYLLLIFFPTQTDNTNVWNEITKTGILLYENISIIMKMEYKIWVGELLAADQVLIFQRCRVYLLPFDFYTNKVQRSRKDYTNGNEFRQ